MIYEDESFMELEEAQIVETCFDPDTEENPHVYLLSTLEESNELD